MPDQSLPTLEYGHEASRRPWLIAILSIAVAAAIGVFVVYHFLRSIPRVREKAGISCKSNLGQIGQAIQLYATENRGMYPPTFAILPLTEEISYDVFTCPSAADLPARSTTTQPATAIFAQPGHCSYIYVGQSLTSRSKSTCIVALDDPVNHYLEGAWILFADGHRAWVDLPTCIDALNQLDKGINPPQRSTPPSPSAARQIYLSQWQPRMSALKTGQAKLPTTRPTQ